MQRASELGKESKTEDRTAEQVVVHDNETERYSIFIMENQIIRYEVYKPMLH